MKNGVLITLHLNSGTILNESFHLELYGSEGILRLGDPNTFGGRIELEKAQNQPINLPYTHGFQSQSRGLGAAEMVWSMFADRPIEQAWRWRVMFWKSYMGFLQVYKQALHMK